MAISSFNYGLADRLAEYRGELERTRAEIAAIETGVSRLAELHQAVAELESLIGAIETISARERPDWDHTSVKGRRKFVGEKLFRSGEIGRTALGILRERAEWLRPLQVAEIMLAQIGHDLADRKARERLTNSVGNYFRKHEGELTESRGEYAKEWQVIR